MVGGTREKGVLCVCVRVCFCVCAEECKAATRCIKMQTQMMYFPLGIHRVRVFIHLSACVRARLCVCTCARVHAKTLGRWHCVGAYLTQAGKMVEGSVAVVIGRS